MPALDFRPLRHDDLPLVHEWLRRPHVQRWWTERESYEEVVARYLPAIEGTDPTDLYLALLDGEPVGFVQTYLVADYPEHAALVGADAGAAGVDLFVADVERTGKGLGTELLERFVEEIVFAAPSTTHCVADPEVDNAASIRAFEKAGFRVVRRFVDPADGKRHALVRRDR
jgi:RimJ/RimL family protein N-acetyltransferase